MSEIGETVNVNVSQNESETLYGCKWSNCKKNHKKEIAYPSKGKYKKGGGYRESWISAGMQPWDPKTFGQGKKRLREDGGDYETMTYEYRTQAHHLVPTAQLSETSTLKDNLVLIDYDCDAPENGMMLPQYMMDIPLHELQAHEGPHPLGYRDPIQQELTRIELAVDGICEQDIEGTLVIQKIAAQAVVALSQRARMKIIAIRSKKNFWPLRTNALQEYEDALKEYARREQVHAEKLRAQMEDRMRGGS